MKFETLIKCINNPGALFSVLGNYRLLNWLDDRIYLKILFKMKTKNKLNLKNPKTYNEKLQWLKIYDRKEEYSQFVDKLEVRKYIENKIGKDYLIPILAIYDNSKEINWEKLPESFVVKCTHGSSCNIIVKAKDELDINDAEIQLDKWMKKNWYYFGREWPYKNVKPKIIIEKYMGNINIVPDDYKILCFNGIPKIIEYHHGRFSNEYIQNFYDINGKLLPFNNPGYQSDDSIILDLDVVKRMIVIAKKLSTDIPHVRVDLYNINNKIYFGELTFFEGSGFIPIIPEEWDYKIGQWIKLPEKRK